MPTTQCTISAGGLVLRPAGAGRELLVGRRTRRVEPKWRPILCQLPKGGQLPGESLVATAVREVREETGYSARVVGSARTASWRYWRNGRWWVENVHYFPMRLNSAKPGGHDREFDEVIWIDLSAALQLLSYPEERALIRQLLKPGESPLAKSRLARTKAGRLHAIRYRLQAATVDDFIAVPLRDWQSHPKRIELDIRHHFPNGEPLIVRSSAVEEDAGGGAMAGAFRSVRVPKPNDPRQLSASFARVAASFQRPRRDASADDHLIVQRLLTAVTLSGVVIASDRDAHEAYYLINYDCTRDATDRVTAGRSGHAVRIFRRLAPSEVPAKWAGIVAATREIEQIYPRENLVIEFGVDLTGKVHIFQVRELARHVSSLKIVEAQVGRAIPPLRRALTELPQIAPAVAGAQTIFSDMADWNPAEMLGPRPAGLDVSFYRLLITQGAWNIGRVSLGYTDVRPAELLSILGDKPYIDTRVSLNSLTPALVSQPLRRRLVDWGLATLAQYPELHDKIEFTLAFPSLDLAADQRAQRMSDILGRRDARHLTRILRDFTQSLLDRGPGIIAADLLATKQRRRRQAAREVALPDARMLLNETAQRLLECRDSAIVVFSRLARLAFVGLGLLRSLRNLDAITPETYEGLLASPHSIADEVRRACEQVAKHRLPIADFFRDFGFLRPMTYNLQSLRYDQMPADWWLTTRLPPSRERTPRVRVEYRQRARIEQVLKTAGLDIGYESLLGFMQAAVAARELAKFVFTRDVSDALEDIAGVGRALGLAREVLAEIPFHDLRRIVINRRLTKRECAKRLAEVSGKHASERRKWSAVAMPPVLGTASNLWVVDYPESTPNFVTRRQVRGRVLSLGAVPPRRLPSMHDRIILLESADPGFDWIFNHHPLGLVTKYGGAGSHMTIRCAAFGVAAAIGCGEVLFARLAGSAAIAIDAVAGTLVPIH